MAYAKIKYEVSDGIATLTFNDPATLNAASLDLMDEAIDAVSRAATGARCLVLTGEGRGFCSGANLSGRSVAPGDGARPSEAGRALDTHFHPFIMALREHPTPVIASVNGAAAGIGCSFALMCDLIIAAESAYFLQAFRRIGLVPDGGSTWILPRLIGRARAMEMALLGDKLPAAKALEWGLINRVTPDAELAAETRALALQLATGPTVALGAARRLIIEAEQVSLTQALHAERTQQARAGATRDFAEGVTAFLQKRPAQFEGR